MSPLASMPAAGAPSASTANIAHRFRGGRSGTSATADKRGRRAPAPAALYAKAPRLAETLMTTQEMERKRIAGDLHDSIGQSLGALRFGLATAVACVRDGKVQAAGEILEKLTKQTQETIIEVQRIAMDLRPPMLDDIGLGGTLSWFCREFRSIHTNLALVIDIRLDERDVSPALRINIFRLVQEALGNVVKHAGASEVHLRLRRVESELHLIVADNGTGFVPEESHRGRATGGGMGLRGMRERAELSGGRFRLVSAPKLGTRLFVAWPLPRK